MPPRHGGKQWPAGRLSGSGITGNAQRHPMVVLDGDDDEIMSAVVPAAIDANAQRLQAA